MKIGIAGAGLLGRLLACQLAQAGHEVHVFDPAPDAQARGAAGWTAAGMLSPVAELECADENVFRLGLRTMELWPGILARLPLPVECRFDGSLLLAHRGDEGAAKRVVELLESKLGAVDVGVRFAHHRPTTTADLRVGRGDARNPDTTALTPAKTGPPRP